MQNNADLDNKSEISGVRNVARHNTSSWLAERTRMERLAIVASIIGVMLSIAWTAATVNRSPYECASGYASKFGAASQRGGSELTWYPCDRREAHIMGKKSEDRSYYISRGGDIDWTDAKDRILIGILFTGIAVFSIIGVNWVRKGVNPAL